MFPSITVTILGRQRNLSGFRFWWLKSVNDYRYDVHCARCLIGPYKRRISKHMATDHPVDLRGELVYLCGVSEPIRWQNNFHAVAKLAEGQSFVVETYNGFAARFDNAVQIPIVALPDGWRGLPKSFTTCRNYQFAVQMGNPPTEIVPSQRVRRRVG